jgi:hypothetical protein
MSDLTGQSTLDHYMKVGALCLAAFTFPALTGCDDGTAPPSDAKAVASARLDPGTRAMTKSDRLSRIADVGNGVYVFPATKDFPETLSDFKESKPELIITSITQGTDETHGIGSNTYARSNTFIVNTELAR